MILARGIVRSLMLTILRMYLSEMFEVAETKPLTPLTCLQMVKLFLKIYQQFKYVIQKDSVRNMRIVFFT